MAEVCSNQILKKSKFNTKSIVISGVLVGTLLVAMVVVITSGFGGVAPDQDIDEESSNPNVPSSPSTTNPPVIKGELSGRYVDSLGYYIEFIGEDEVELFLKEDAMGDPMLASAHGHYNLKGDNKIAISYTIGMFGFGDTPGIISEDKQEISIFKSTFTKQ